MGLRLYINDWDNNEIIDGGAWDFNIYKLFDLPNTQVKNYTKENCTSQSKDGSCFMCDCDDDTWYKVTLDMLIEISNIDIDVLNKNSNIISSFIIDEDDWWDLPKEQWNTIEFMLSKNHREFVWMNIN